MQPPHNPYGQQAPQPYGQPAPYMPPNPYAAPAQVALYRQNVFVPPGTTSRPLLGSTLRNVKLGLGIAQVITLLAAIVLLILGASMSDNHGSGEPVMFAALGAFGLWYVFLFAYSIVNMCWLYGFWSWIPPEQRYSTMWKKYISPAAAVGFMFIPYFNIYWMFVVYLGIADIMERLRVQYPTSKGPAKTLAIVTLVVPLVFFPAAPFLQFMFAKHVEEMAKEMQARMPGGLQPV